LIKYQQSLSTGSGEASESVAVAETWTRLGGNSRGALLMLVNAAVFSAMVTIIKAVSPEVPVFVIMFFSVATQFAFIGLRALRAFPAVVRGRERSGAHLWRCALLISSMLCGYNAVTVLPLAVSTSISFSKSIFVTLLAALFLAETVGFRRWLAVAIGFAGVLILANPASAGAGVGLAGALAGVASAATAAGGAIMTRRLAQTSAPSVLLLYQTAVGTAVLLPLAAWTWSTPAPQTLALLVLTGLLSVLGNVSMIAALRVGEASAIAPIDFSRAPLAGMLGYLVFGEVPGAVAVLGMAVILAATLLTFGQRDVVTPTPR
jgi:drug/metabolite transporter (DMT)-like permease